MPRVYISSTYRDLKPYREAAARAARAFECETIAMEDYVATDERPLDKCLADVRRSDIYVGIIAKRYGFRPPGQDKSITQLEYEAAVAAGEKVRIFFLEEGVTWTGDFTDSGEDAADLARFLKHVQESHTGKPYNSPDNLEAKVSQSLGTMGLKHAVKIPDLLPYLSDRSDQELQLATALQKRQATAPCRPLVVLVHGDEHEAHGMFVKRMRERILPKLLRRGHDDPLPAEKKIEWSDPKGDVAKRLGRLHGQMMMQVADQPGALDLEVLRRAVAQVQGPVMITSSIPTQHWEKNEGELIEGWLKWWEVWPDLGSRDLLAVVLSVQCRNPSGGAVVHEKKGRGLHRLLGAIENRSQVERNRRAEKWIDGLDWARFPGVAAVTLDRLKGVTEAHVEHWFTTSVSEFCRANHRTVPSDTILGEQMLPLVKRLFEDRAHVDDEGRISMAPLATELRRILQQSLARGGT